MKTRTNSEIARTIILPALAAAVALALSGNSFSQETAQGPSFIPPGLLNPPAKIAASSSSLELLEARRGLEGDSSEPLELLRTSFDVDGRRGQGTDLLVRLDGECAAWVNAVDAGEEEPAPEEPAPEEPAPEEAVPAPVVVATSITAWVELDGVPIAVSGNLPGSAQIADDGAVVFCNSDAGLDLASLEQPDAEDGTFEQAVIDKFQQARTANGFSWTLPEVGTGFHELVVKARLDLHEDGEDGEEQVPGDEDPVDPGADPADPTIADAIAVFGKRLLVVERTRIEFDEQPTDPEI